MKNNLKTWLIVSNTIFGVFVILSLPMILMSPMMFDAPGSTSNPVLLIAFYSLLTFPIVVIATIIVAWVLYRMNKLKPSLIVSLFPFLNILLFFIGISLWG